MPSITYAEAAALAQRLDRERERGATLRIDGRWSIDRFDYMEDAAWIDVRYYGHVEMFFGVAFREMTAAEFEAYWRERITLLWPGAWPTGEAVTWSHAINCAIDLQGAIDTWLTGESPLGELPEHAERLAALCRAMETGENAGG